MVYYVYCECNHAIVKYKGKWKHVHFKSNMNLQLFKINCPECECDNPRPNEKWRKILEKRGWVV